MPSRTPPWPRPSTILGAPTRRRLRTSPHPELGFTWVDGERLIRFGKADAGPLLHSRGFDGYALLTTERFREHPLADAADVVALVGPGPVPEVSAAARPEGGGRPGVALGGGRGIDSAKGIGAPDRLPGAAGPTTLSGGGPAGGRGTDSPVGRGADGLPPPPRRGGGRPARAPVARDRRSGAYGVGAAAPPRGHGSERARARCRSALHAAGEPRRKHGGAA